MKDELKNEYYTRNVRWAQRALDQLSFYNNLLLSLSIGFLAFSFNPENFENHKFFINEINWLKISLTSSILFIVLSILLGFITALCRLKDFRITRAINQIRQRTYEHSEKKLDERTPDKFKWSKRILLILRKEPQITIEECKNYNQINFDSTFRELRNIAHNLGLNSWDYTILQTIFFAFSLIFYIISIFIQYV